MMQTILAGILTSAAAFAGAAAPSDWTARLEALDPRDAEPYFILAEEVADAAHDDADRALSRRLYALAGALAPGDLGRSACLAIADLEADDNARRRFTALADLLDDAAVFHGTLGVAADARDETGITPAAALAVAEALGHYRVGAGSRALGALRADGAMPLLREHEAFLRGGVDRFVEDCRLYRGRVRPSLSTDAITRLVQLEVALLAGEDRSWTDELMVAGPPPLIEVDPTRLAEALEVNPDLCLYRDGQWVER